MLLLISYNINHKIFNYEKKYLDSKKLDNFDVHFSIHFEVFEIGFCILKIILTVVFAIFNKNFSNKN